MNPTHTQRLTGKDYKTLALAALGGELSLWKVRMKPGKPVALSLAAAEALGVGEGASVRIVAV